MLNEARSRGLNAVEELNRVGLLHTPGLDKDRRVEAIQALLESLEGWRPIELLRRRLRNGEPGSPQDMYICILEYIQEYILMTKGEE